jgi:hypothetical protein
MLLGAWFHWLFSKNDCKRCGIEELKREIKGFGNLVSSIAEKAGITLKEQLEIKNLER